MRSDRPIITVLKEPLDVVVEILTATFIILLITFTYIEYANVADTIPIHFNAKGEVDNYGSKSNLWLLPVIGIFEAVLMYALSKYPHLHNYMVNITEENALKNYRFSARILRFTSLGVILLFCFIQYIIIQMGKGNEVPFKGWIVPVIVGMAIVLPIFLFIYSRKINKR